MGCTHRLGQTCRSLRAGGWHMVSRPPRQHRGDRMAVSWRCEMMGGHCHCKSKPRATRTAQTLQSPREPPGTTGLHFSLVCKVNPPMPGCTVWAGMGYGHGCVRMLPRIYMGAQCLYKQHPPPPPGPPSGRRRHLVSRS